MFSQIYNNVFANPNIFKEKFIKIKIVFKLYYSGHSVRF